MLRFSEGSKVRRILVVDDEVAVLELVRLTLEADGFEIATVAHTTSCQSIDGFFDAICSYSDHAT